MLSTEFIDLLKTLIRAPSVVGSEHSFFRILQRELEERGAVIHWYEGLLVAQGSDPFSIMFSAHIDRHGLICTGPNEFQYSAFVRAEKTDLLGNSVSEELMEKVAGRFMGEEVYAYEPWSGIYRGKGIIRNTYKCEFRNNLIFELEGLESVVAGTPVAFRDRLTLNNGRLEAQLDNVLSAAVLVNLFNQGFKGTCFFTAQEEAGKSWRFLLEWFRRFGGSTNRLFVLDTSPFPTVEAANEQLLVLRRKDANASFNADSTERLRNICDTQGFSYLYKDAYMEAENLKLVAEGLPARSIGSTEMGRTINASGGLVDGTTIQVPTSGYHTMQESVAWESVDALLKVVNLLAEGV